MAVIIFTASCSNQKYSGFEQAENGVYFKIHEQSNDTLGPKLTNWVAVNMDYRMKDTLLFSSKNLDKPLMFAMIEPEFDGDLYEALSLMKVGDSMTFAIVVDSFFFKTAKVRELPSVIEPGSPMYYDVRLLKVLTDEEFKDEIELKKEELRLKELADLAKYIDSTNIAVDPLASGLYFIPLKKGSGVKPDTGDMCKVYLSVQQLDGTPLFSNFDGEPLDVEFGKGFDTEGFSEGLGMLKIGGKAQLIVPSSIGVGETGRESVLPFTTLIYEVELDDIRTVEEVRKERADKKKALEAEKERLKDAELQKIKAYVAMNDITVEPLASGMYFIEVSEGKGVAPKKGERVKVHYILRKTDGREIQNSYKTEKPADFILGQGRVIKGWDQAIALMKKGGKAKIIVPSKLAYGSRGRGKDIGAYEPLVFEIELLEE